MDLKALLLKYIDVRGLLVEGLLAGVVKPALDKLVADTSNTLDDSLVAFLYPELEKAATAWIDAELAKLGLTK